MVKIVIFTAKITTYRFPSITKCSKRRHRCLPHFGGFWKHYYLPTY